MKYNTEIISKECFGLGHYACNYSVSKDGKVIIPVWAFGEDYMLRSDDFGGKFEKCPMPEKMRGLQFRELSDGTFMALGENNAVYRAIYDLDNGDIPFALAVYRAKSIDDIIKGNVSTSICIVDIPGLTAGYGDSGNRHTGDAISWIQLSNGDIYVMMYGQFKDDKTLCPYFTQFGDYKFYLYRTWTIVSHDMGKSFEFVTTVADCQTYPIKDVNAEGYCEAEAIETEEGHLVSIIRTGGHEVYSPLYCTHSFDCGKTWEKPYEICDWGVLPRLLKMKDGTLVCASGHIHTMLLFSDDNGRTWSEPHIIDECDGKWDRSPSGYSSVFECEPGVISLVYDDPKEGLAENREAGKVRKVYAVKVKVTKE